MTLVLFVAAIALAQDVRPAARPDSAHLVTVTVAEDRGATLGHTIEISSVTARTAASEAELAGRGWRAMRTSVRGEQTVEWEACPALRQAALTFGDLPPIPLAPPPLRIHASRLPLEPTIMDGFSTRLTFRTLAADGSEVVATVAGGTAYADWANDTINALSGCWGPLRP